MTLELKVDRATSCNVVFLGEMFTILKKDQLFDMHFCWLVNINFQLDRQDSDIFIEKEKKQQD